MNIQKKIWLTFSIFLLFAYNLPAQNLLTNGDFEWDNIWPWVLWENDAEVNANVINGQAVFEIIRAGTELDEPHLAQLGLNVTQYHTYSIRFDARAEESRSIVIGIIKEQEYEMNEYIFYETVELSTVMETHEYSFISDKTATVRIDFLMGMNDHDVTLDNVIIEDITNSVTTYQLTVNNGTGSGSYPEGAFVKIIAEEPAENTVFDRWSGYTNTISNTTRSGTWLIMPGENASITAEYKNIGHLEPAFYRQGYTLSYYSYGYAEDNVPKYEYEVVPKIDRTISLYDAIGSGANSIIFDFSVEVYDFEDSEVEWYRDNIDTLMDEVTLAKDLGIHTLIKPLCTGEIVRDNWQMLNPSNPAEWFRTYGEKILTILNRPDAVNIDAVILGNELHSMTTNPNFKGYWEQLISDIRAIYDGEIGYNAGGILGYENVEEEEFKNVTFINSLDFIGISSYPNPIRTDIGAIPENAGYDEYYLSWTNAIHGRNYKEELNEFIDENPHLDVYFTELGSPAIRGGVQGNDQTTIDLEQQAAFYAASLDALRTVEGLKGIYVYNWCGNTPISNYDVGFTTDYHLGPYKWNVYDKPAEDSIKSRYWIEDTEHYRLKVLEGIGEGTYPPGTNVPISADAPPIDYTFEKWTGLTENIADPNSENTSFTMPDAHALVKANYRYAIDNLLLNGDFETGNINPWELWTNNAEADAEVIDGMITIDITQASAEDQTPSLIQKGIGIEENHIYSIRFDAKAEAPRTIYIGFIQEDEYVNYIHTDTVNLLTNIERFEFTFTSPATMQARFAVLMGSDISNVSLDNIILEDIGIDEPTYKLEVNNGTGDGEYKAGIQVEIVADAAEEGYEFDQWIGDTDQIANIYSDSTYIIMPDSNVEISAAYTLSIDNLLVNGSFETGSIEPWQLWLNGTEALAMVNDGFVNIEITTSDPESGRPSLIQKGIELEENHIYSIRFDAKSEAPRTISIAFIQEDEYVNYSYLEIVHLTTDFNSFEYIFTSPETMRARFSVLMGSATDNVSLDNLIIEDIGISMPTYSLLVQNGSGDGDYTAGTVINIIADDASNGEEFAVWTGQVDNITDIESANTTIVMPPYNVSITATFIDITGNKSVYNLNEIPFYPNPSKGRIFFNEKDSYSVTIYDLQGRKVADFLNYREKQLDLSTLKKGLYLITLDDNRQRMTYRLFIY